MPDYKEAARDYVKKLDKASVHYLYVRPFTGGPDYSDFYNQMYGFLNVVQTLNLPPGSKILDVGCGPGWVAEYLAMLGYQSVGIDISEDMIRIAEERTSSRKYCVSPDKPLACEFHAHDIEDRPFEERAFDAVLLLSALHHFEHPEKALKHLFEYNLVRGGRCVIREGIRPQPGSVWEKKLEDVMEKFGILERPFGHEELIKMLYETGFNRVLSYAEINGLYIRNAAEEQRLSRKFSAPPVKNILIAVKEGGTLDIAGKEIDIFSDASEKCICGFYAPEVWEGVGNIRWSSEKASLCLKAENQEIVLEMLSFYPSVNRETVHVKFYWNDSFIKEILIDSNNWNLYRLNLSGQKGQSGTLSFSVEPAWVPALTGHASDRRVLGVALRSVRYP